MKSIKIIALVCVLTLVNRLGAQELYDSDVLIQGKDTLKYRIMYPKVFSKDKQYPLVLFFHGAGERGNDNQRQLTHGSALFASQENRESFPAIVIFPQCVPESYWSNAKVDRTSYPISLEYPLNEPPTKSLQLVLDLMDDITTKPYVNANQVYVGGLSMGGMGTFEILSRRPDMFAAAIAICGGGNPELAQNYATKTAMWVFHGANDNVVAPQLSLEMVNAILNYGGKPNFTLYAKDNHNSWDSAFAEPELLSWLFSNSKK